jgi:hypothetical protein
MAARRVKRRMASIKKDDPSGLFIPAGLFLGMGLGFLYNNIPAGIFIGLGIGFVFFAMARVKKC